MPKKEHFNAYQTPPKLIQAINEKALSQEEQNIAIVGATIISENENPPIYNGVIVIKENRIMAVGKAGSVIIPKDAEVMDATGLRQSVIIKWSF